MKKKKKKVNNNYKVVIMIGIVFVSLLIVIGSTFGLWITTFKQQSTNRITTGCFQVEFSELSSRIQLNNTYPVSDERGLKNVPYSFKIKNICDIKASCQITLNTLTASSNKIPDSLIRYVFYEEKDSDRKVTDLDDAPVNEDTNNIQTSSPIQTSYIMGSEVLDEQEEKTYYLKLWISDNATTDINGYQFESSLNVTTVAAK